MFASRFSRTLTARKLSRNLCSQIPVKESSNSKHIAFIKSSLIVITAGLVIVGPAFLYSTSKVVQKLTIESNQLTSKLEEVNRALDQVNNQLEEVIESEKQTEIEFRNQVQIYQRIVMSTCVASFLIVLYATAKG